MHVIYVFGDSITYGAWDMGTAGWTAKFRNYLDARHDEPTYYFYPLGIHGETTDGLTKRFTNEFEARRRHDDTSYTFIFAYGANDATWLTDQERFKTKIEDFDSNLTNTINQAKELNAQIFLLEITPVNEQYSANLVARNKSCLNEYVDQYNECLQLVAESTSTVLIKINKAFHDEGLEKVLVKDGLHPTQAGHEVIFQKVKTEIDSLLNSLDS
jgi:lysophospholipase L1-like esterase